MQQITMKRKLPTPYLLVIGSVEAPSQLFLVTDCAIIMEVTIENCIIVLLSAYFAYNICYPRGCVNVMSLLEVIFVNAPLDKLSPSSRLLFSNIESH